MFEDRPTLLTDRLKLEARHLGFDLVGIAPAVVPPGYPNYLEWLRRGHEAGMGYMRRQAEARRHPSQVLEGVRSVVMVGIIYGQPGESAPDSGTTGNIARYAKGLDYHELFWRRLETLRDWLLAESPGAKGRAVADTAPLMERDFARLAGLGWIGKNTMLINKHIGSYTLLGALLTDLELQPDLPHEADHCGTCTRCLDACPTEAFVGPQELDARRCISYWTIEHKGMIPDEPAEQLHGWAFGCDICQEVCPWNRKAPPGQEPDLAPRAEWTDPDLIDWLTADPFAFKKLLKGTAMARAKRSGLLRNAALILGRRKERAAIPALIEGLKDSDVVIRSASAWALGRLGGEAALQALQASENDPDPLVVEEVRRAIAVIS